MKNTASFQLMLLWRINILLLTSGFIGWGMGFSFAGNVSGLGETPCPKNEIIGLIGRMLREKGSFVNALLAPEGCNRFLFPLLIIIAMGAGLYGAVMGITAGWRQSASSLIKVPALLLLTLGICFPALHIANVLLGAKLTMSQTLLLILFSLALCSVLLASLAPISAFFGLSSGYHFMKLLHVACFALCGFYSMSVLHDGLSRACAESGLYSHHALAVFRLWVLIYGFVGAQLAWMLRPFMGEPSLPREFLRRSGGRLNFYSALWLSVRRFFSGKTLSGD